jgi:hypothetical protein
MPYKLTHSQERYEIESKIGATADVKKSSLKLLVAIDIHQNGNSNKKIKVDGLENIEKLLKESEITDISEYENKIIDCIACLNYLKEIYLSKFQQK